MKKRLSETKREKFVRLAEGRVNSILDQLKRLPNLSNKNYYEYNENDIKKIFVALGKGVKEAKDRFENTDKKIKNRFKL